MLTNLISRKPLFLGYASISAAAMFSSTLLLKNQNAKKKPSTLFFKFVPLILASGNTSLGTHALNSPLYTTNSGGYPHTVSVAKSSTSFSRVIAFLEHIIKGKLSFLVFSNKLLCKLSAHFYNSSFYKTNHLRNSSIMKFFSNRATLLAFPQKAIRTLEILSISTLLVLDVNYYLRSLYLFCKKGVFSVGLVEASTNSHFISLPFIVNKVSLMQQILMLRLAFYLKSRSTKSVFDKLKLLSIL